MGCMSSCEKCGCCKSYYSENYTKAYARSCRGHRFMGDRCIDCGATFGFAEENCYHRWSC